MIYQHAPNSGYRKIMPVHRLQFPYTFNELKVKLSNKKKKKDNHEQNPWHDNLI